MKLDKTQINDFKDFTEMVGAHRGVLKSLIDKDNYYKSNEAVEINNLTMALQSYTAESGRYVQEHGLMIQEMAQIQAQYQTSLKQFISKYTPTPGVQGDA